MINTGSFRCFVLNSGVSNLFEPWHPISRFASFLREYPEAIQDTDSFVGFWFLLRAGYPPYETDVDEIEEHVKELWDLYVLGMRHYGKRQDLRTSDEALLALDEIYFALIRKGRELGIGTALDVLFDNTMVEDTKAKSRKAGIEV